MHLHAGTDAGLSVQRIGGGVAVAGTTTSALDIASPGAFQANLGGGTDAMVHRFDDLGVPVWSTYYGGPANEDTAALTRDGLDNLLLAGRTASTSGIASLDGLRAAVQGGTDAYLVKLDPDGLRRWATYYGGAGDDLVSSRGVVARGVDDIYLAGRTASTLGVATHDALFQPNFGGATDLFLAHFGQNLGDACAAADECESRQCVDGVCCDQVCAGVCDVCSVAAGGVVDGTCALLPVDECASRGPARHAPAARRQFLTTTSQNFHRFHINDVHADHCAHERTGRPRGYPPSSPIPHTGRASSPACCQHDDAC